MANEDHVKILEKGQKEWNDWRSENPNETPDLSDVWFHIVEYEAIRVPLKEDASDINLFPERKRNDVVYKEKLRVYPIAKDKKNVKIRDGKLSVFDLRRANLSGSILNDFDLSNSDLQKVKLEDAKLINCDLKNANFKGANLTNAVLKDADMSGSNMSGAVLTGATLENAKLNDTNWIELNYIYKDSSRHLEIDRAVLSKDTNLKRLVIRNANFSKAGLSADGQLLANMDKDQFGYLDLGVYQHSMENRINVPEIGGMKVIDSNSNGVNFSGVDLSDADLSNSYMCRTILSGANLSGANLSGVDLRGVNFLGSNLTNADLSEAILENANLRGAIVDKATLTKTKDANDIWQKNDSAKYMKLSVFQNSLLSIDSKEEINNLKWARRLHFSSLILAGFFLIAFMVGKSEIPFPLIDNFDLSHGLYVFVSIPTSIGLVCLCNYFMSLALSGSLYIICGDSKNKVGNYPWIISRYSGAEKTTKNLSLIARFIMSFHVVVYLLYFPTMVTNFYELGIVKHIVIIISFIILFGVSIWTFIVSEKFQKPFVFSEKIVSLS